MSTFQDFEKEVFFCKKQCPLRSTKPGFHPKYGGCNEKDPILIIVSENPGKNPRASQVEAVNLDRPRRISKEEVAEYFAEGESGRLVDILSNLGLALDQIYYTSAYKCASPGAPSEQIELAKKLCKEHLRQELSIIRAPVVVTLGKPAFESVYEVLSDRRPPKIHLKSLANENSFILGQTRLVALPHGAGLWRNPPVSLAFFQERAVALLKPILEKILTSPKTI